MRIRALACLFALSALLSTPASAETIVSLTFDDGLASQLDAGAMLAARGLEASFFVNTGRVGDRDHLDWPQIEQLAAEGHEIGGHTVNHPDLSLLDLDAQLREICDDRFALLAHGFAPRIFAFPFNHRNEDTPTALAACGYNAARSASGLDCDACPAGESIPPADPWFMRAVDSVHLDTTLADLRDAVEAAEREDAAWVQFVFHHVCIDCDEEYAVAPDVLEAFADWLVERGTPVRTIGEVIGGGVQPGRRGPPETPVARPEGNLLANGSLEDDADGDAIPDCWKPGGYGNNRGSYERVADAFEGAWGARIAMSDHVDGDRKLISTQDGGACAPPVQQGTTYVFRARYRADTEVRAVAYVRNADGAWRWWAQGPTQSPSSAWREAVWTLPAVPDDATHLSIGLSIRDDGALVADAFSLHRAEVTDHELRERERAPEKTGCASSFVGLAGIAPLLRRRRRVAELP